MGDKSTNSPAIVTGGAITRWLSRAPISQFNFYAATTAFVVYFCMYAFRKPFSAAKFSGGEFEFFGLELKTAFVISQILGYAASKYMGIGFCSSAKRPQWKLFLVGLVVWAELCLLAFAVLPGS